ncbi:E3 ubiquitin-protein ligase NEURL3 [Tiliqua scincoides]|uniref:E3 ubiquitin-protein ligase NEURL3 n=1 Tax=Tiliqua scincoides TaxID=71010 RepID=UPI00346372A4
MDQSHRIASRAATFHNGIVFSNRPVQPYEKVKLKILEEDCKWKGGLRLGFTGEDPSRLEPNKLPPFVCPNLVSRGKTWACVLPEEYEGEGTIISFWMDGCGSVFCSNNHRAECSLLFDGVPVTISLWAVVDIYGRTKAVQLLDPSSAFADTEGPNLLNLNGPAESTCKDLHALPEVSNGEECVVCCGAEANATMLPCCHSSFCAGCSLKILHTSGCCPLCRQRVEKVLCSPVWPPKHNHAENWLKDSKNLLPPR